MRKIFVLYDNPKHNFDSVRKLADGGEIEFIFSKHSIEGISLAQCRKILENRLDQAVAGDLVVMNGPSYMSAIAGYVWLSQEDRKAWNMVAYNTRTQEFELKEEPYGLQ